MYRVSNDYVKAVLSPKTESRLSLSIIQHKTFTESYLSTDTKNKFINKNSSIIYSISKRLQIETALKVNELSTTNLA